MHPNRVGLRSTLLVTASLAGILVGALAGYGCSSGASQRSEPLPIATAHRTPRLAPMVEPPVVVQAADVPPPVDPYEPRPAVPSAEPDLRVRIAALRAATASARVSHPAGGLVMSSADGSTRTLRSPVDVRCNQNAVTVTEGAGTKASRAYTIAGRQPVDFKPPVGARTVVTYDGIDWPGALRVVPTNDGPGAMDLVVSVPMEQYLPGVLARELYKSWNPETFRAQAIAARSYAVCERAHWETCRHYDLIAGEASQAWIGEVKDVRARQAVADTRGMVLVFEDKIVPAYYSSTCGGVPANAVDSLTRNPNHGIAPLEAGADAANSHRDCCKSAPRFRWEQTLPVTRVVTQLRRWAGDQLAVERASLARVGANAPAAASASPWRTEVPVAASSLGEPMPVTIVQDGGAPAPGSQVAPATAQLARDSSSNAGAFPVGMEIATDAPLAELAQIAGLKSIEVLANNQAGRPIRIRLVDSRGATLDLRAEDFRRAVNYAREGEATPRDRLNSSNFRAQLNGATISFTGAGLGHGVGMCQYGAESMAQRGVTAPQILRTYYPDATVRKAY